MPPYLFLWESFSILVSPTPWCAPSRWLHCFKVFHSMSKSKRITAPYEGPLSSSSSSDDDAPGFQQAVRTLLRPLPDVVPEQEPEIIEALLRQADSVASAHAISAGFLRQLAQLGPELAAELETQDYGLLASLAALSFPSPWFLPARLSADELVVSAARTPAT